MTTFQSYTSRKKPRQSRSSRTLANRKALASGRRQGCLRHRRSAALALGGIDVHRLGVLPTSRLVRHSGACTEAPTRMPHCKGA